ncbi:carboxypeptidase-like regulatory domain-containing protein [Rhodanobacter lindaniclasticus]
MKLRNKNSRIKLRRSALAIGLALSLVGGSAFAQSHSAGAIFGDAAAGTQITIVNTDTGQTRTITADAKGRYRASELQIGNYAVTGSGESAGGTRRVYVGAGGTEVDLLVKEMEAVTVSATSMPAIDVSRTDTAAELTATILNNIPVARDVTTAILAPSVIPADSRLGNCRIVRRRGGVRERLLHQRLSGHQRAHQYRLDNAAV